MDTVSVPDSGPSSTERVDALLADAAAILDARPQQSLEQFREAGLLATALSYNRGTAEARWNAGKCLCLLGNHEAALPDYAAALALFEALDDPMGCFKVLNSTAVVYSRLARFTESGRYYEQALALCDRLDNPYYRQVALRNLGLSYDKRGDYHTAVDYINRSLALSRETGSPLEIARNLHHLGEIYTSLSDYTTALECLLEAAQLSAPFDNESLYSLCLASIGTVYMQLGRLTSALDYVMQLLHRTELNGNRLIQAKAMFNIGKIYAQLGNTSTALTYFLKCLRICESTGDRFGEAETLHSLAEIFLHLGDHANALAYARKALALCRTLEYRETEIVTLHTIALIHRELKEYDEALALLHEALEFAINIGAQESELNLLNSLAALYKKTGDTKRSKHHAAAYKQLARKLFSEDDKKKTLEMIREFEEQKAREEAKKWGLGESKHDLPDTVFTAVNRAQFADMGTAAEPGAAGPQAPSAKKDIFVTTFGRFSVVVNGRELSAEDWQRKKARDIFKVLLINHRKAVSIDELIDLLWSDTSGKNIVPTIWNSISYIRKALEPGIRPQTPSSFIRIIDKSYMLDLGDDAVIDFLRFRSLIAEAHHTRNDTMRIRILEEAAELYSGDFLREDIYEEWSCFERESLKNQYLEVLVEIAGHYRDNDDDDAALAFARRAIDTDHTYEEAYEIVIGVLVDNGQTTEAQKVLRQCRDAFDRELGCPPPKYLEELLG